MAPATASTPDPASQPGWLPPAVTGLGARILAINALSVLLVGASFLYLDSYRNELAGRRVEEVARLTDLAAVGLTGAPERRLVPVARAMDARLRLYDADGRLTADSWRLAPPNFTIATRPDDALAKRLAARLDRAVDRVVLAREPAPFVEPAVDSAATQPPLAGGGVTPVTALAPDRTLVISAGRRLADGRTLLATLNPRDLRRDVRAERLRLGLAVLSALLVTALLSAYLTRTIAQPIRRLARAARLVRQGRRRDVAVPRMADRRDEIGLLARGLSDMTGALRDRMDAIEAFAADVAHELKNPLASLSSAAESLERVEDPELRRQLIRIVSEDARRMDRLVTDVSEASRLDATLARSRFEPVDLTAVLKAVVAGHRVQADARGIRLALARPRAGSAVVAGLAAQLARAFDNVVANAISFAPPGSLVDVQVVVGAQDVEVAVEDEGPGVAPSARDAIFARFHSDRPPGDERHSGLGLAIARTVVEGHRGTIAVDDRADGRRGARVQVRLPLDREG